MGRELRDYQIRAIEDLRQALRDGFKRPLLMMPTGAGKTAVACEIIQSAVERGKRCMFTVPAIDLIDQTFSDFFRQGIYSIGVIQADHPQTNSSRMVQIASLQTLSRRNVGVPDIMIVDEAHRRDKALSKLMRHPDWAKVIWIGLSATPWARGLGEDYDKLIIATTTAELTEARYLSPFRVFAPAHPDLSDVKIIAGEYQNDQLGEAMQKGTLVGDIASTWLRLGENRPTICFAVNCAHAMAIQAAFEAAGVACGYQDAQTPRDERKDIARKFRTGELRVVANVGTLTTGIDWDVRCIIFARPTKSEMLYVQCIGRGLRTAEGKDHCLILDHSDTTMRLGFVTDILHEILDDGKSRKPADRTEPEDRKEPLPKPCSSCSHLKPPRVHTCPACGFTPKPKDIVETMDGDIIELSTRRKRAKNDLGSIDKAALYASLKRYQIDHNYQPGWVAHKYKERTGVWPRGLDATPAASVIDPAVASWIRSRNIARAKAAQAMQA
jgi:DNA repair protein RadD